jgi:hypothetical protein
MSDKMSVENNFSLVATFVFSARKSKFRKTILSEVRIFSAP